jgi:hypothetical protein
MQIDRGLFKITMFQQIRRVASGLENRFDLDQQPTRSLSASFAAASSSEARP